MATVSKARIFFFQAEDGIRDGRVTGVQTCALPILMALMGTPSPFPTSTSRAGLLRIGVANRLFGCAAFSFESGVQSFPRQSIACFGGAPSFPSHQTSLSSVRATFV